MRGSLASECFRHLSALVSSNPPPFPLDFLSLTNYDPCSRIDLNPSLSEQDGPANGETEPGSAHPTPAESTTHDENNATHHRRRISSYIHDTLNARRMRDASVEERIATLRQLRQEQQDNVNTAPTEPAPQTPANRARRLSSRLRDTFRIRTRQHGDDSTPNPTTTGT
jgi:hypothetical protein